ncbi:DivIVA domain-containing protein [Actinocorallia populi]|uniref:DivIVA domain-containing protein n=1 Tax=Actinocorallia populi TaxID=2079200 RepID=UPI0018E50CBE|nr:DivIVA domain-containing protein [Actinocorallia populi]
MARFPRVLRGYFTSEVDALLLRIEAALGRTDAPVPPITADELRATKLSVVVRGYDPHAVDGALLEYARELEHRERGGGEPYTETVAGQVPWLVRWIEQAQFSTTRLRPGYRERDVDELLDRVTAGLLGQAPPVHADDIRKCVFGSAFLGAGYNEVEVDRFLDELAAALDHLRQAGSAPG